eukprot:CAMPEP_0168613762 /NCGR_PEP_ID=MMETSP0449_2-20121227/3620_1 /TAXON_ID=1082188 /ORGANISM="Strombidium rassoulzadegani, Strain ras09" /LENGTH=135 /DNA_ID=CAMNT_0008654409 /DNA_START=201 /DNA_END=609 /DNA_ORIENTATION=+
MKFFAIAALFAAVEAKHHHHNTEFVDISGKPPAVGLGHAVIPATREEYDNAATLWKGDWAKYRAAHPNDQDCSISESDNWKGASSAPSPGSAEEPDSAREADGAPDMTVAREPPSPTRPPDSPPTAEPQAPDQHA